MSETKINKYWVTVSHTTETNYTLKARSIEEAEDIFEKVLSTGAIGQDGVDEDWDALHGKFSKLKPKPNIFQKSILHTLNYEGDSGTIETNMQTIEIVAQNVDKIIER